MKKVLFITDMYPDEMNPVSGIFVKQQVEELAKHYDVKVMATSGYFARMSIMSISFVIFSVFDLAIKKQDFYTFKSLL